MLECAAERDEAASARQRHAPSRRGPILVGLFLVLTFSGGWSAHQVTAPVVIGTPEQRLHSAQVTIYLAATAIERFRSENGRLPESMLEAGDEDLGIEYLPDEAGYLLRAAHGEVSLEYHSGEDLAPYSVAFLNTPPR